MKSILLFLGFFLLFGNEIICQCDTIIPFYAHVVDIDRQNVLTGGGTHWICSKVQADVEDKYNVLFVEDSCFLISLSTLPWTNSDFNTVFMKAPGEIIVGGDSNTIYYETGVVVKDIGIDNNLINCSLIIFDYSNAPVDGCDEGQRNTNVNDIDINQFLSLYPNPVSRKITISSNYTGESTLFLIDFTGKQIYKNDFFFDHEETFDLPDNIGNGIYIIKFIFRDSVLTKRIVVSR